MKFTVFGHFEYDRDTLAREYRRDLEVGINPDVPANYFPGDDPSQEPKLRWNLAASTFFSNWINYAVYQETPYRLEELEDEFFILRLFVVGFSKDLC